MNKKEEMSSTICALYSIYFSQNTHLDPKLDKYTRAEWGFTWYFCSNNTRSRDLAVLFNNNFEFKVKGIYRDSGEITSWFISIQ